MRDHVRCTAALFVLALLFFLPLWLHAGGVLYSPHSDLLAEHVPARRFLVRSFQETGELPLWCPHLFAGTPFVHDIQVGMFYPPHLVLLLIDEGHVGYALSLLVFLHVVLAGMLMYSYARARGMSSWPAVLAGVGFMFGGRWTMHLLGGGHYILIGLAWLPLVLLGWEKVIERRSWLWGILAGTAYALMVLSTQPQWTFYSGLFAALWTLCALKERRDLLRWAACGAMIVVLAVGLSAVQLLPTLEAARLSSRSGGVGTEGILAGGVRVLLFLVGPAIATEPFNLEWEDRGGLALLWLVAAVWAPLLDGGRTRREAAVCLGLFLFAMGGAILFQALPGFNLFRQPARMAVVAGFPIAWLVAVAFSRLTDEQALDDAQRRACRRVLVRIVVGCTILVGGFALRMLLSGERLRFHLYYVAVPLLVVRVWLLLGRPGLPQAKRRNPLAAVLVVDLLFLGSGLVRMHAGDPFASLPDVLRRLPPQPNDRILDLDAEKDKRVAGAPLGSGAPLAPIHRLDAVRGYSPLDVRHYREFLQMIADEDRPLHALESNFSYPVIGNFPIVNPRLLDLLGTRRRVQPADLDPPDGWRFVGRDDGSVVYDFLAGGMTRLPPLAVYENENAFPRAFLVPRAEAAPNDDDRLATFRRTDFKEVVLIDGPSGPNFDRGRWTATIDVHEPNRVRIVVDGEKGGWLVLTDVWFPGWTCTIDGNEEEIRRADHSFRAVPVGKGRHVVEFVFRPESVRIGRIVTTLTVVAGLMFAQTLTLFGLLRRRRESSGATVSAHPRGSE